EVPPLVMRCGAFGDMVLLTVLLRQLAVRFGKRVDVISSGPWTRPLLDGQGAVGRLRILRSRRTPYWLSIEQHRLVAWLRERGAPGVGLLARASQGRRTPARRDPSGEPSCCPALASSALGCEQILARGPLGAGCQRRARAAPGRRDSVLGRRHGIRAERRDHSSDRRVRPA